MMKKLLLGLGLLLLVLAEGGAATVKPRRQPVYMFGFAASFTDSIAFMTDLQAIEAYVMPNGFLADRSLYSLQLNNYLVANRGLANMTCVVFFNKKKAKAEKKYQKVRKKYREAHGGELLSLGVDMFRFEPEEWVETTVTEMPQPAVQPEAATQSGGKTNKKKRK